MKQVSTLKVFAFSLHQSFTATGKIKLKHSVKTAPLPLCSQQTPHTTTQLIFSVQGCTLCNSKDISND